MVQRVGGGDSSDQDEHDQTHSLLTVVGPVGEAHAGAGEQQQRANPERRRLRAFRRFVEFPRSTYPSPLLSRFPQSRGALPPQSFLAFRVRTSRETYSSAKPRARLAVSA